MRLTPFSREIAWRDRAIDTGVGALAVLGMAPFHFWPLMLLSLALFYVRLASRPDGRAGFSTGFWTGFGYFSLGMFWIAQAFIERGPEFIPLIIPLVLGLFILLALFWGAAGAIFVRARLSPLWSVSGFVSFLWLAEYARGHLFGGFPWNLHGYSFEAGTALSQAASLIGVWGLSALALLMGALLGLAWRRKAVLPAALAAMLLAAQFGFGVWRLAGADAGEVDTARLRLVYVPFRQAEMMDPDRAFELTNRFFEETLAAPLDGVTHIVWPEGAVRGLAMDDVGFLSVFPRVLPETAPLPYFLFSSIRTQSTPQGREYFNSAVMAGYPDRAPAILATTDKKRLVPFGEIVPFESLLSRLGLEAIAASFTPAPTKPVSAYPGLPPVSVQICYEVIFTNLSDEPGAAFILNQSNDAWFGGLHGPAQHAAIARMRSVETGLPLLRSAANGWSGTVDAYGRWITAISPTQTGHTDVRLPTPITDGPRQAVFGKITMFALLLINLAAAFSTLLAGRTSTPVKGWAERDREEARSR